MGLRSCVPLLAPFLHSTFSREQHPLFRFSFSTSVDHWLASQNDGRDRLRTFWTPTQQQKQASADEDGHDLLLRAGFLRQAHSGIFHLLPLGLRVLDKVERLIDKHMRGLSASKVSLSSISSQDLWRKSGRFEGRDAELFQLQDRKETKYLLSPTHEEEITNVVKNAVHSYRDLPLRLYQVSRKYRDEARPRQGLLRGREFIMKDLYTFDATEEQALKTYENVRAAYTAFLDELKLPYLVANADSGNMGGELSHEYHFASANGEDIIIKCRNCRLSINEELYLGSFDAASDQTSSATSSSAFQILYGRIMEQQPERQGEVGSRDSDEADDEARELEKRPCPVRRRVKTIVQVMIPSGDLEINLNALKKLVRDLDTTKPLTNQPDLEDLTDGAGRLIVRDPRVSGDAVPSIEKSSAVNVGPKRLGEPADIREAPFLLTKASKDDSCPSCGTKGSLHFHKAVEIGHTFHLGNRYSKPLEATIKDEKGQQVEIAMGCHGIGVSRLVGAVASLLADGKGLNWPVSIAPYSVLLVGAPKTSAEDITATYDHLQTALAGGPWDFVIDDRERALGWKLNDADLIGYPFIVVLGKAWPQRRAVELQCRRLGIKEEVSFDDLSTRIRNYSDNL